MRYKGVKLEVSVGETVPGEGTLEGLIDGSRDRDGDELGNDEGLADGEAESLGLADGLADNVGWELTDGVAVGEVNGQLSMSPKG